MAIFVAFPKLYICVLSYHKKSFMLDTKNLFLIVITLKLIDGFEKKCLIVQLQECAFIKYKCKNASFISGNKRSDENDFRHFYHYS